METLSQMELDMLCLLLLKYLENSDLVSPMSRALMRAWLKLRRQ